MIVVQLIGGLGNQMFQYAFGRAISEKYASKLLVDLSIIDHYENHNGYELGRVFNLPIKVISKEELKKSFGVLSNLYVQKIAKKLNIFPIKKMIIEPSYAYTGNIKPREKECLFFGYWQSYKYFSSIEQVIRDDFRFLPNVDRVNSKLIEECSNTESVSIHVRRGDYVKNVKTNKFHGTCSISYYEDAIKYIKHSCKNPLFYVFSDDIEWARRHLPLKPDAIFVSHNEGRNSFEDMRLMSLCKHNIIANSSFSWWGAWLNSNPEKCVIAPKKWFARSDLSANDLIPLTWVRL